MLERQQAGRGAVRIIGPAADRAVEHHLPVAQNAQLGGCAPGSDQVKCLVQALLPHAA